ncbi:hypothetical protein M432DRAFT_32165 [Thermoascus aurantiacus ATCC 26904]
MQPSVFYRQETEILSFFLTTGRSRRLLARPGGLHRCFSKEGTTPHRQHRLLIIIEPSLSALLILCPERSPLSVTKRGATSANRTACQRRRGAVRLVSAGRPDPSPCFPAPCHPSPPAPSQGKSRGRPDVPSPPALVSLERRRRLLRRSSSPSAALFFFCLSISSAIVQLHVLPPLVSPVLDTLVAFAMN